VVVKTTFTAALGGGWQPDCRLGCELYLQLHYQAAPTRSAICRILSGRSLALAKRRIGRSSRGLSYGRDWSGRGCLV